MEKAIFDQWKQDDACFISTKACEEVGKKIQSWNFVIVAGHSGSGKSAIIQHISLQYRKQGWAVRRVKKVQDIIDEYSSSRFQKNKTICVFNDPLGKEAFDEILNNSWQTYEEELKLYLNTAKLVMSSRNHIVSDTRVTRFLLDQSHIVNIDDNKYKLSANEKRQILTIYTPNMNLSDKDCDIIVEVETYFPLLCKLYSSKKDFKNNGVEFFTEPVTVLKEEIMGFRKKDKGKYCALALLVLFNDDLCVSDLLKNKDMENKFKHTLKLCGLPKSTEPAVIGDNLQSIKNVFVKKIGDSYHFYHDFVMEVTSLVFGTDYPTETIKYADIGFLRRRVGLGNCEEQTDSFAIYLSDKYTEELGERLFSELFGERLLDVVLNSCLRNEKVIEILKKKMADNPENLQMFLEAKKCKIDEKELRTSKDHAKESLKMTWGRLCPIHIVSVFHNYQLLDIDLCEKNGVSLENNGVDTSLACGWQVNPALVDCFDKEDSTVDFLLQKDNILNNLYDPDSYFSLFVSCQVERVTRMIFKG
uniref:Novel STAND NTPase 3 domain-containing protein n=1 Tax=Magallana gigas TaxID=29159 RepID=A0A8W8MPF6_MAGGI